MTPDEREARIDELFHAASELPREERASLLDRECAEDPAEIRPALEAAAKSGLPAVIQVVVDQEANVYPPGLMEFATIGTV